MLRLSIHNLSFLYEFSDIVCGSKSWCAGIFSRKTSFVVRLLLLLRFRCYWNWSAKQKYRKTSEKKEEYNHPPPCILHIHIWYLFNCAIYSGIVQFSFWFFVENEHPNCLDQNEIERKRIITIIKKKSNYRRRVAICLVRTSAWRSIDFVYPSTYTPVNGFSSNSTHHQCWSITNTIKMFHTNLTNGPSRHASHQKKNIIWLNVKHNNWS